MKFATDEVSTQSGVSPCYIGKQQIPARFSALIHISQSYPDNGSVVIKVEGSVNGETLSILEDVYNKNLRSDKRIAIDLKKIGGVDRDAKAFFKAIHSTVQFIDMPAYLQLEIGV